jgi:serine/threonine protein kinase
MRVTMMENQPDMLPLRGEIQTVYKFDPARSNVWLESDDNHQYIVKRFEVSPAKQWFLAMLGIHPGQCETRAHRNIAAMGIPVVPIQQRVWQRGKLCLITPDMGQSLDRATVAGAFDSPAARHHLAKQLGQLTALLLERQLFFRDLKCSNILIDADGTLRLIDAGSIRKVSEVQLPDCLKRMLRLLEKTAIDAASQSPTPYELSKTDRLRFAKAVLQGSAASGPLVEALGLACLL